MQHKKQPTVAGNLGDVSICTSTTKTLGNYFPLAYGTFICWHVDSTSSDWKGKTISRKKLRPLSNKIVLASEYYFTCVANCFAFRYLAKIYYMSPERV